ncbi:MAG: rod shape-determining protein MreC [Alphaproteobacteria bacterium]|nr:MAG: rod shape-determining protein MreC [Alphaproteobacteria bacterium]
MIRLSPQLRAGIQRSTLPALILLSAGIVLIGKTDQTMFERFRTGLSDVAAPVLDIAARPLGAIEAALDRARGLIGIYQENRRLEQDNARLLQWQQVALKLTAENRQLQGLLKVVPDRAVSYVTARVIANSGGAYVRTVMVNAGTEGGLARGQAAITGDGLVGRLTEVGSRAARVLLITDLNSRIPVKIEGSHTSAVLAGDNSERPRLLYVGTPETLKIGDRILTSGEGGVFPPDLPVGVVSAVGGSGPRVEPYVELSQLSYVMVVDYGLSGSLPQPIQPMPRPGKRAKVASNEETQAPPRGTR